MPWELGFFDGFKQNVAILPVLTDDEKEFKGQEYLSLYPYVDIETIDGKEGRKAVWVNRSANQYLKFNSWKQGKRAWRGVTL